MKFFDTHCDTVGKVLDGSLDFQTGEGSGHISLPGMLAVGSCTQVFACFVLSAHHPGKERETAEAMIRTINEMAAKSEGKMEVVRTASELCAACDGAWRGPIHWKVVRRTCAISTSSECVI
jgi:microsomal dipeptidase-like Zn-dependent dipeptidase